MAQLHLNFQMPNRADEVVRGIILINLLPFG